MIGVERTGAVATFASSSPVQFLLGSVSDSAPLQMQATNVFGLNAAGLGTRPWQAVEATVMSTQGAHLVA
jgi:hypothetical protein